MFKQVLDQLTCSIPGCNHSKDAPVYLHSRCHPSAPHRVIKTGCWIKAHCRTCGKIANAFFFKEEKLVSADWKPTMCLGQQCHPDEGIWTVYRAGSGVVAAVCARCDKKMAEFTVPDATADRLEVRIAPTETHKVAEWLWAVRISPTTKVTSL